MVLVLLLTGQEDRMMLGTISNARHGVQVAFHWLKMFALDGKQLARFKLDTETTHCTEGLLVVAPLASMPLAVVAPLIVMAEGHQ